MSTPGGGRKCRKGNEKLGEDGLFTDPKDLSCYDLNNNDAAQKLKGIICNKLPSVIGYLKEVHHVGQAEEKPVRADL